MVIYHAGLEQAEDIGWHPVKDQVNGLIAKLGDALDVTPLRVELPPARRASGTGKWDQPNHTTCRGRPLSENPTYSAFWRVFGVTCLRMQRLASSMGFGTMAGLGPRKILPCSGVRPEPQSS